MVRWLPDSRLSVFTVAVPRIRHESSERRRRVSPIDQKMPRHEVIDTLPSGLATMSDRASMVTIESW
jgi:hypothetical protein